MTDLKGRTASIADEAHAQIRRDIIFGTLEPGEKLKLDQLRGRYGVSVSTLRETLNRLAAEGFVLAGGQRGFEVAPVSAPNLEEIAELRCLLECRALELSFAAGGIDWEADLVAAHHKLSQLESRMMAGDVSVKEQWKRYDWEFHRALIAACGSRELSEILSSVSDKYLRYQMLVLTHRGETAAREHRELLDAAMARDTRRGQEILRRHIDGGVRHCLAAGIISDDEILAETDQSL